MDSTGEVPHGLESKPDLDAIQSEYWMAFQMLATTRPAVDGRVCHIPYQAISMYLDDIRVTDVDERLSWTRIIQRIDSEWVQIQSQRIKKQREDDAKKQKAQNRVANRRRR